jgi:hypothetical protein
MVPGGAPSLGGSDCTAVQKLYMIAGDTQAGNFGQHRTVPVNTNLAPHAAHMD